ncbi:BadF/BadG/BcrA/BcrD type ATPase [Nitratireductor indicus C115]|uniref:BadF/BadG/BcrA/BcrD type ATPase n=1 Tax=Nitratireductor indicus C115 TaxID=1231190 RepID=K2P569_9HYPH|nr:BadF/BadG/BcrA/BcrD ATPase family protein [Nitratireductor indicus]EKF42501.1 BadF/BadG/BcrA/BcrD type ATPase [Nitratireductor indicus C115]SFQ56667.1 glucosamine kinase [Nitratireductor indicus]
MYDYVIAIDGGGTSCRAALADRNGRVLGRAMRGAANIFSRADAIAQSILAASNAALAEAGLGAEALSEIPAFFGLAGINVGMRQETLAAQLPFPETRFVHDGIIALQGALGDTDGVIAILGTGSAYVAREKAKLRSIGGWGFMIGDQASGAVLGRTLLAETLLANDGIHPQTELSRTVMERFGGNPENTVEFTVTAKPADYGAYAPMILEFAERGDPLAGKILDAAVRDVTDALDAVVFPGCTKLCLLGGLAPHYGKRLLPRHRSLLHEAEGDALAGAVQLAVRAFIPQTHGAGQE